MSCRRAVLAIAACLVGLCSFGSVARAQQPVVPTAPPVRTVRPPRDTTPVAGDTVHARGDSVTARDTAAKANFAPADSVMQRLLGLPGYEITRYEGKTITFDAVTGGIGVTSRGIVLRDSNLVKSDTIKYGGAGSTVKVNSGKGGQNVMVTPGQAPIFSTGPGEYDIEKRSARVSGVTTSVEQNGQTIYISGDRVKAVLPPPTSDSAKTTASSGATKSEAVFYLRDGTVTACDDSIPDYYFKAGEIKRTGSFIVARPAVLYIGDVPVMWLPFLFQDVRGGRHSGILAPNIGVSDIVRNSPSYRRSIEGLGYYWSISDFLDAQAYVDWRSSAGQNNGDDEGFARYNGEVRYRWIERYVTGNLAVSQIIQGADKSLSVSLDHSQDFTRNSSLRASMNYSGNTTIQRETTINPYAVTSTIHSQANYDHKIGPMSFNLGGSRRQYPGRTQADLNFPTVSLSTSPLNLASWLSWTPNLSYAATMATSIDQAPSVGRFLEPSRTASGRDTLIANDVDRKSYTSAFAFDTPIQIFGYNLGNRFSINSERNAFPELQNVTDVNTGVLTPQVFATTYETRVDWTPQFTLPSLGRNRLNLTAGIGFSNVDGGAFLIRNERTGGQWVRQSKRWNLSLSAAPTLYGLFGGFGPFTRIRHSISPTIGYSYAPAATVSDEFLRAVGHTKYNSTTGEATGYLGSLASSSMSFGLSTNIEGKRRAPNDSNPEAGEKIKILTLDLGSLSYNFETARATHKAIRGLTTETISPALRSDLLPGFDLGLQYSLFEGSTLSDSARFKPVRTNMHASFSFSHTANPFAVFSRLFGRSAPSDAAPTPAVGNDPSDQRFARQVASQPVAGRAAQRAGFMPTTTSGWQASFSFSQSTPRPVTGTNVIEFDPTLRCQYLNKPGTRIAYDQCVATEALHPPAENAITSNAIGAPVFRQPNVTSLNSQLTANLTEHWAASVTNTYDFEQKQFATQIVSLQRDLHDWRAIFAFTQSPNGAFAFNFLISLKAEPELKFDYHKATYRGVNF